jgi:hypothetical protein
MDQLIKDYFNIILIINKEKKGLLISYTEAILKSNGEYILTIKSGNTFATNNILYKLNNYINNTEDILEFNLIINYKESIDDNSFKLYKCKHFKSEINIDSIVFNKNYKKIDQEKELIINKMINSKVYKNIIKENFLFYKDIIVDNYLDEIILFLLKQNNITIKNIDVIGLIEYSHIINSFEKYNTINKKAQIINDSLFYINFLYDHSPNTENDKLYALDEFYNLLSVIYNKYNEVTEERKKLIYKYLNCTFIPTYNKNLLKTYFNALIDRNKGGLIFD